MIETFENIDLMQTRIPQNVANAISTIARLIGRGKTTVRIPPRCDVRDRQSGPQQRTDRKRPKLAADWQTRASLERTQRRVAKGNRRSHMQPREHPPLRPEKESMAQIAATTTV